jgi:hypothetical protein
VGSIHPNFRREIEETLFLPFAEIKKRNGGKSIE